jgi:mannosylglycerate hydrolase
MNSSSANRVADVSEPMRQPAPASPSDVPRWTAYVVPHTHWDREWYQPFEVFRARLVDVIDRVLELLDHPQCEYRRFTLDGQASILDDYLDVRPQRRARIARLVAEGRLRIGPWYVLADEYLVSPEALVRNLQLGLRTCRDFGGAMPVAYTPDSFGHVSQLPLLVAGFGLDAVVFERGVGDEGERLGSEFAWVAADGSTEVFAVHLVNTYSAVTALGHVDWEYRDGYDPERAVRQACAVLFGPEAGEAAFPPWLRDAVERLPGGLARYARGPCLLLPNGSDHLFPQANLPAVIDQLNASIDAVRFVHGDVGEFVAAARQPLAALERYQGEFRASRYHHVLSGVWSSRLPLKQANHASETLLERYAEPLLAMAWWHHGHDDRDLLRRAWRTLLLNHAHDSICGCSVDAVHREMAMRFAAVDQLGGELCQRAAARLTEDAAGPEVAVFQPQPRGGWAVVDASVEVPAGEGAQLTALDEQGRPLPVERRVVRTLVPGRSDAWLDRVDLTVAVPTLPMALTRLRLAPRASGHHDPAPGDPVQVRRDETAIVLENRTLRLRVTPDGALRLLDRASGVEHALRLRFEDQADAGDTYDFSPLAGDQPAWFAEPDAPPEVARHGELRGAVVLRYRLDLPRRLADDRAARVGRVTGVARVALGLAAFAEHLDLTVELDNGAEDHRLRLRLDTDVVADHVWADGHWDVLQRPLRPPAGEGWYQVPVPTGHMRRFVAVSDARAGVALLARGLPEYEADHGADGVSLAVTLLRCVGWLSRDDLTSRPQGAGPAIATPEAQCQGPHRFELGIAPFAGPWWQSRLPAVAEGFSVPARAFRAGRADLRPDLAPAGTSPSDEARASLGAGAPTVDLGIELTPPLQLSALKLAEAGTGLIVRLWNPALEAVRGRLSTPPHLREVHRLRLDETRLEPLAPAADSLEVCLGPKDVLTIELTFHGRGERP